MREIVTEMKGGDKRATLAFDVFAYRVKKYIGAYAAVLCGLDAVIFTGGIGENSPDIRKASCSGLQFLGIDVDDQANESAEKKERSISRKGTSTAVLVIPTNEELVIALDTMEIVSQMKK
jgi:acetate kinase